MIVICWHWFGLTWLGWSVAWVALLSTGSLFSLSLPHSFPIVSPIAMSSIIIIASLIICALAIVYLPIDICNGPSEGRRGKKSKGKKRKQREMAVNSESTVSNGACKTLRWKKKKKKEKKKKRKKSPMAQDSVTGAGQLSSQAKREQNNNSSVDALVLVRDWPRPLFGAIYYWSVYPVPASLII